MDLLIDGAPVDFSLEGETRLSEVVSGVQAWLRTTNRVVSTVTIGTTEYPFDDERFAEMAIEELERVDVATTSFRETQLEVARTVHRYLVTLAAGIEAGDDSGVRENIKEFALIDELLGTFGPYLTIPDSFWNRLRGFAKVAHDTDDPSRGLIPDDGLRADLSRETAAAASLAASRHEELADPHTTLVRRADSIAALLPGLEEVSANLQLGRETEAYGQIAVFSGVASSAMRILADLYPGLDAEARASVDETNRKLGDVLGQAEEAMHQSDPVLLGDLLEYDIAPVAADLVPILRTIAAA